MFKIDGEPTDTVMDLKTKIEAAHGAEMAADRLRLILEGKVLKDTQTVAEINVTEQSFIVCMVSKDTKVGFLVFSISLLCHTLLCSPPALSTQPKPAPAAPATTPAAAGITSPAAASAMTTTPPAPAPPTPPATFENPEALANLLAMGMWPEADIRAALNAAQGSAELAYHFLENGIPENLAPRGARASSAAPPPAPAAAPAAGSLGALEGLRRHPQFDELRRTVQQNPAQLQAVLGVIGQQQPELLQAIMANEAAFLAMMNEPIVAAAPGTGAGFGAGAAGAAPGMMGMGGPGMGMGAGAGGADPMAMIRALAMLPPDQRAAFAAQLGLPPEALAGLMQMLASMPPAALNEMMQGGGPGEGHGGVIHLTREEAAAVQRLQELGGGRFSQQQAAEAYLSCDRNEQMAAQLLFDGGFDYDDFEGDQEG